MNVNVMMKELFNDRWSLTCFFGLEFIATRCFSALCSNRNAFGSCHLIFLIRNSLPYSIIVCNIIFNNVCLDYFPSPSRCRVKSCQTHAPRCKNKKTCEKADVYHWSTAVRKTQCDCERKRENVLMRKEKSVTDCCAMGQAALPVDSAYARLVRIRFYIFERRALALSMPANESRQPSFFFLLSLLFWRVHHNMDTHCIVTAQVMTSWAFLLAFLLLLPVFIYCCSLRKGRRAGQREKEKKKKTDTGV